MLLASPSSRAGAQVVAPRSTVRAPAAPAVRRAPGGGLAAASALPAPSSAAPAAPAVRRIPGGSGSASSALPGPPSSTAPAAARRALAPPPRATNWFAEGKAKFFEALAGQYDAQAVNAFIDAQIAGNRAVVFSWTTCPYCVKAKAALQETGAKFEAIELNTLPDGKGKAIKAELAKRTGRTSVPQVWIGGEFVGGCNDGPKPGFGIVPLKASGQLQTMLKAAGAL